MKNKISPERQKKGMRYPPLNELVERANNKYELVIATAKRARDIVDGAVPYVSISIDNPISIATEEIDEGFVVLVHEDKNKKSQNPELTVISTEDSTTTSEPEVVTNSEDS